MIKVEIVEPGDSGEWNTLVKQSVDSTFYHLWEWSRILSLTYGYPRICLQVRDGETLIGGLLLMHVKSRIFGSRLVSLPFCEYGGPIIDSSIDSSIMRLSLSAIIKVINKLAKKFGVDSIELRNPPLLPFISETLFSYGYSKPQRYVTFRLNLAKPLDQIWDALRRDRRRTIQGAVESGLIVDEVQTYTQLKAYYELYLKTQIKHGSPPNSYSFFETIFDLLYLKKMCKILVAKYQSRIIGGTIIFYYKDTVYWWNGVIDDKYRHLGPTDLLVWEIIEWGAKNNFKILDFGRTRINTTIYSFKKGWGGQKTPLYNYLYFLKRKELPDPTQKKYAYLSRIWSLIPTILTQRLGPRIIKGIAL